MTCSYVIPWGNKWGGVKYHRWMKAKAPQSAWFVLLGVLWGDELEVVFLQKNARIVFDLQMFALFKTSVYVGYNKHIPWNRSAKVIQG